MTTPPLLSRVRRAPASLAASPAVSSRQRSAVSPAARLLDLSPRRSAHASAPAGGAHSRRVTSLPPARGSCTGGTPRSGLPPAQARPPPRAPSDTTFAPFAPVSARLWGSYPPRCESGTPGEARGGGVPFQAGGVHGTGVRGLGGCAGLSWAAGVVGPGSGRSGTHARGSDWGSKVDEVSSRGLQPPAESTLAFRALGGAKRKSGRGSGDRIQRVELVWSSWHARKQRPEMT